MLGADLKKEQAIVAILACINFTHLMDFVIMMPLGPQLMRVFGLSAQQFSLVVSSYTFSAAATGVLGAFVLDRWDRRPALLFNYAGFIIGTGLCAAAPSFFLLLLARTVAGAFGGLVFALVFSILGDAIPFERRGKATGTVMSAFAVASIVGVPLGLFIASHLNWHAPFVGLASLGALVWLAAYFKLPHLRDHLTSVKKDAMVEIRTILVDANHWRAFAVSSCLMLAAYTVIPFISPYVVNNVGMTEEQLPLIYLVGGSFTFFTSRWFGVLADKKGKKRVYRYLAILSIVPILLLTHLPRWPLPVVLLITTLFMVLVAGRFVPAMALITASAAPGQRGGFMSLNGSVQQLAVGFAALLAGMIITNEDSGALSHYDWVGYVAVSATIASLWLVDRLKLEE